MVSGEYPNKHRKQTTKITPPYLFTNNFFKPTMALFKQHFIQLVICIAYLNRGEASELQHNATNLNNSNCTFANNESGYTLDLNYFVENDIIIRGIDEVNADYYYQYTPCQNGITSYCTNGGEDVPTPRMAYRYAYDDDSGWCYDIAAWDNGLVQPIYYSNNMTWYFYYETGMYCSVYQEPGKASIYWTCNNTADYNLVGC